MCLFHIILFNVMTDSHLIQATDNLKKKPTFVPRTWNKQDFTLCTTGIEFRIFVVLELSLKYHFEFKSCFYNVSYTFVHV